MLPRIQKGRGMLCLLTRSSSVMKLHLFPGTGKCGPELRGVSHPAAALPFTWTLAYTHQAHMMTCEAVIFLVTQAKLKAYRFHEKVT